MPRSTTYAALLRGVNLGAHNRIRMPELRALVEGLGCTDVSTYVQSGNVVFCSDRAAASLAKAIEQGIRSELGLDIAVVIRSRERSWRGSWPAIHSAVRRERRTRST